MQNGSVLTYLLPKLRDDDGATYWAVRFQAYRKPECADDPCWQHHVIRASCQREAATLRQDLLRQYPPPLYEQEAGCTEWYHISQKLQYHIHTSGRPVENSAPRKIKIVIIYYLPSMFPWN